MNYAHDHDIEMRQSSILGTTETVMIDKFITLGNVAKAMGMEVKELAAFNPSYKKQIINGTPENPRMLVIPRTFDVDYAVLYSALTDPNATIAVQPKRVIPTFAPKPAILAAKPTTISSAPAVSLTANIHVVKPGENLVDVASTYGVDIEDLKKWNRLRGYSLTPGRKLKLAADAVMEPTVSADTGRNG
jgi:membrane-bound lytic murein transglycosylase D